MRQKLTRTWFWRSDDPVTPPKTAEWVVGQMERYVPMNVNFMLNLSPNLQGKLDENLIREFERIGELVHFPSALEDLPSKWVVRKTTR